MPRIKWKKSELVDGLQPTFGTLTCEVHGPDEVLRDEWVSAVQSWEESLGSQDRQFLPCLCGERTQEQTAVELGMKKRTVQRRVQSLRERARRELVAFQP